MVFRDPPGPNAGLQLYNPNVPEMGTFSRILVLMPTACHQFEDQACFFF